MSKEELIEKLAEIEHTRWADWQRWCHKSGMRHSDDSITLTADCVARWERQIETPYAELSEREKESDREQVYRYWPLIAPYVELADTIEDVEYPIVVTLPKAVYGYLAEVYHDDPDVATTIREMCIATRDADRETPER